jgi:hypothetical protein
VSVSLETGDNLLFGQRWLRVAASCAVECRYLVCVMLYLCLRPVVTPEEWVVT